MIPITVAVITYKRPLLLLQCLISLSTQTLRPDKIIVVDNDPALSARTICLQVANLFPIIYLFEPSRGAPAARNTVLKRCKTRYLAFIDDDCVAASGWLSSGATMMKRENCAFVVGKSKLGNSHNLIAREQYRHYAAWFRSITNPRTYTIQPEGLDTKNVLLDTQKFKKNHVCFDTQLTMHSISGGEDADFGFQLDRAGLHGTYAPNMILFHREAGSLPHMLSKAYSRGKLHKLLDTKWGRSHKHNTIIHLVASLCKRACKTFMLLCLQPLCSSGHNLNKSVIELLVICHDLSFCCGYQRQSAYHAALYEEQRLL